MNDVGQAKRIVRFGVFEANFETGELRKNGAKVPLQGQPFQVFAILLEHVGELVGREELRQKVWPEDTFVDFDHALNTAITKIRVALGDDADNPRFVETLPRRGYRFIGPVAKRLTPGVLGGARTRRRLSAIGVAALVLLSAGAIWRFRGNPVEPPVELVPLASLSGYETTPSFSPDGNEVAFVLRGS